MLVEFQQVIEADYPVVDRTVITAPRYRLFYSHLTDLWGGGGEAGRFVSILRAQRGLLQTAAAIWLSGGSFWLSPPRIFWAWSWGSQVGEESDGLQATA